MQERCQAVLQLPTSSTGLGHLLDAINSELNQFLRDYKIKAYCCDIKENPLSRIYDFSLLPGSKVKNLEKYSSEITMFLREYSEPTINIIYQQNMLIIINIK